jgi:TDG/mug DNA glycosylase family protein
VEVLPDIVGAEPIVVFCGLAGAESTRTRDHYYASPGNNFWSMLHLSGLTPERMRPEDDVRVTDHGLGLTDLVGWWDPPRVDVDDLVDKVVTWQPEWLAFTSKDVAAKAARALGHRKPGLGPAAIEVGRSQVFVLPGTSGANQRRDYDGRVHRLSWWLDLAALVGRSPHGAGETGAAGT